MQFSITAADVTAAEQASRAIVAPVVPPAIGRDEHPIAHALRRALPPGGEVWVRRFYVDIRADRSGLWQTWSMPQRLIEAVDHYDRAGDESQMIGQWTLIG